LDQEVALSSIWTIKSAPVRGGAVRSGRAVCVPRGLPGANVGHLLGVKPLSLGLDLELSKTNRALQALRVGLIAWAGADP